VQLVSNEPIHSRPRHGTAENGIDCSMGTRILADPIGNTAIPDFSASGQDFDP